APSRGTEPAPAVASDGADGADRSDESQPTAGSETPEPTATASDHEHGYGTEQDDRATAPAPGHHSPGDSGGLPQRRRRGRATPPSETQKLASAPAPQRRPRRPAESAAALGALQSGTAAGRSAAARPNTGAFPAVPEGAPAATTADTASDDTDHDRNDHEGGTAR
ncbi:protein kinase, partial [Streptomyces sp. NPDC056948]